MRRAVFLPFDFVSVQSQAAAGMLLHRNLVKSQKSSLCSTAAFLDMLYVKISIWFAQNRDIFPPSDGVC
jgi:hypothetical protein